MIPRTPHEHWMAMSEPNRSETGEDPEDGSGHSRIERYFRPVVEDEGLRPVVASVLIGLSTVLGWGLLLAVRDRKPSAIIAVLLLGLVSAEWIIRARRNNRRLGAAGWSVIVLWIASVLVAVGGEYTGYL
jgi:hypothetical protein